MGNAWPDSAARTAVLGDPGRSPQAVVNGNSNPWFVCGSLSQLSNCALSSFPPDQYEYGFKYNSPEALAASCLTWNTGLRLVNRVPYIIFSDNPTDGTMRFGGAIFYTGTNATDDDQPGQCAAGFWRQRYWVLGADNSIQVTASNGCYNLDVYCRLR